MDSVQERVDINGAMTEGRCELHLVRPSAVRCEEQITCIVSTGQRTSDVTNSWFLKLVDPIMFLSRSLFVDRASYGLQE
jgi:hypothetical protein